MNTTVLERFERARAVLLTTYKRSGTSVATPLWGYLDGRTYYVTTGNSSWKVKRLRTNPSVLLAPCNQRGKITGEEVAGTARILNEDETAKVLARKKRRYPVMSLIHLLPNRGAENSVGIAIELSL